MREGEPSYCLETVTSPVDENLRFSLAPAPNRWPRLVVIGGSPGLLKGLSWLAELLRQLPLRHELYVPAATQQAVPWLVAHSLPEAKAGSLSQLQEHLGASQTVIAGIGLHLSSSAQIGVEKLLLTTDQPTLITDELVPLYKTNPQLLQLAQLWPLVSLAQLIKLFNISQTGVKLLPDRGIFNVGSLLVALPTTAPLVTTYDRERIYTYVRASHTIVHTPLPAGVTVDQLRAVYITALALTVWTDRGAHSELSLVQLAHHLIAECFAPYEGSVSELELEPQAVALALRQGLEPK